MSREDRAALAEAQAEIVRALVADGPIPDGFRREHVVAGRQLLRDKRRRVDERRARARARREQAQPLGWGRRLWSLLRSALRGSR